MRDGKKQEEIAEANAKQKAPKRPKSKRLYQLRLSK